MRNFLALSDIGIEGMREIFIIADELVAGGYSDFLDGYTSVMFFPTTSMRTRITFEKGINRLGGQVILFPPEVLDKREELRDVAGYLNNWTDTVIIRHKNFNVLEQISQWCKFPIINAMTEINHPCEILSDLYAISKLRDDFLDCEYLFCGCRGNIGYSWREAAKVFGLSLTHCCPEGFEMDNVTVIRDLRKAVIGKDVICTDSYPTEQLEKFNEHRITYEIMSGANYCALLNPCPPFYRGEEVSSDAIESKFFVGYKFKKNLLEIQQAIIIYCLTH